MTKCKPLSAANLELEGPELFSPGTHGSIIPNFSGTAPGMANGGSGAITMNQHFASDFAGNAATREELFQMVAIGKAEPIRAVRDLRSRGVL